MNKRLIVVSFSASMLFYTSYNQASSQSGLVLEEEEISFASKDSLITPKDTTSIQQVRLKGKSSSYYRYLDLAKEKERRKKIRAKYQKGKLLKK